VAALTAESAASWSFPARLLLAQAYCVLGRIEPGAKMIAELRTRLGRHVAVFKPQLRIAEAWLAAAQGNVSAAIESALEAARLATLSGHGSGASTHSGRRSRMMKKTPMSPPASKIIVASQ